MRETRRKEIAAYIARRRSVTMTELCRAFHVSMNTIRADVAFLTATGTVEKVYGGARSVAREEVPLFTQRTEVRPDAKQAIAAAAASLIRSGEALFLDAGTTTMHLLDALGEQTQVAVITGSLYVIEQAASRPNIDLIVLPGSLNRRTNSVADVSTLELLGRYHFDKAFLGAAGVTDEGKLIVSSYLEYEIKKLAVRQSAERILLCDSGKFGGTGLMHYGTLADMTRCITDGACPPELRELCARQGTELTVAR